MCCRFGRSLPTTSLRLTAYAGSTSKPAPGSRHLVLGAISGPPSRLRPKIAERCPAASSFSHTNVVRLDVPDPGARAPACRRRTPLPFVRGWDHSNSSFAFPSVHVAFSFRAWTRVARLCSPGLARPRHRANLPRRSCIKPEFMNHLQTLSVTLWTASRWWCRTIRGAAGLAARPASCSTVRTSPGPGCASSGSTIGARRTTAAQTRGMGPAPTRTRTASALTKASAPATFRGSGARAGATACCLERFRPRRRTLSPCGTSSSQGWRGCGSVPGTYERHPSCTMS